VHNIIYSAYMLLNTNLKINNDKHKSTSLSFHILGESRQTGFQTVHNIIIIFSIYAIKNKFNN